MVPAYLKLDGILGWMSVVPEDDSTGEEEDELLPPNPLEVLDDRFLFFAFLFICSDVVVVVSAT